MAVTRLWKVTDSLDKVIDYAEDETKTKKPKYSNKEWQALKDVLEYAKDEEKTEQALSFYDTGVSAEYGDKLITLSTCEYSQNNGRFVVVAKQVGVTAYET